jgi:hypothetical protein
MDKEEFERKMEEDGVVLLPQADYESLERLFISAGTEPIRKEGKDYDHMMLTETGPPISFRVAPRRRDVHDSVVFLGGTCNEDPWRETAMEVLDAQKVPYFNPVVKDWDDKARAREEAVKSNLRTIQLFMITSKMTGVFSIAEVVHAGIMRPEKTLLGICKDGFDEGQLRSLRAVSDMVASKGCMVSVGSREFVVASMSIMAGAIWKRFSKRV